MVYSAPPSLCLPTKKREGQGGLGSDQGLVDEGDGRPFLLGRGTWCVSVLETTGQSASRLGEVRQQHPTLYRIWYTYKQGFGIHALLRLNLGYTWHMQKMVLIVLSLFMHILCS